jgi:hypothetical protein
LWKKSAERAMYAKGQCEKMKFRVGLCLEFGAKKDSGEVKEQKTIEVEARKKTCSCTGDGVSF